MNLHPTLLALTWAGYEVWAPVGGRAKKFADFYEVSHIGRIRNRCTGAVVTPHRNDRAEHAAYPRVTLYRRRWRGTRREDTVRQHFYVHRLVAAVFCHKPTTLHREVHHEDKDKQNASCFNLRYVTRAEHERLHSGNDHFVSRRDQVYYEAMLRRMGYDPRESWGDGRASIADIPVSPVPSYYDAPREEAPF